MVPVTAAIRTEGSANKEGPRISISRIDYIGRWRRIVNPHRSRDTDPDDDCCLRRDSAKRQYGEAQQATEGGGGASK
jgi:hypothetical protein